MENIEGNQLEDVQNKLANLEMENKRQMEEFNNQRGKMKGVLLQKEAELKKKEEENSLLIEQISRLKNELDDTKSQLVVDSIRLETDFELEKRKANEEIASLQRLVHETVEESSSTRSLYDQELNKLQSYIQHLQKEIEKLKIQNNQSQQQQAANQEHSLAPSVVINACKDLAKKLSADAFGSQDEKSTEKPPQSQDDVELLKSLVDHLKDQIKALKEKLRSTDEQLQKCKECRHIINESSKVNKQTPEKMLLCNTSTNTSFDIQKSDNLICDMCSNYEAQLVNEQQKVAELQMKVQSAEKAAERHKEELIKEIGFRKEMEEKWNEKREEHKRQVAELTRITDCTEQDLKELKDYLNQATNETRSELSKLTKEREIIKQELRRLQTENENLVGKYTIHSQKLQSEMINLPVTVEELHELVLRNHQDLIIAKIGKEEAEEKLNNLQSNLVELKGQIEVNHHEINELRRDKDNVDKHYQHLLMKLADLAQKENRLLELGDTVKTLESQNSELKGRVHSLQQELETSTTVQRDFVRLSQSLQVQLEKIRESDIQVRWQHDEDVENCTKCRAQFSNSRKKQHCKHCGQIFCQNCLSRSVQSGPNQRLSRVCDVCHTLLVKSSAPYFSEEPPMT